MSRQPQSKPFDCGAMVATSAPPYFRRFRLSEYFAEWQWPRVHSFCNTDGQTVTQCLKDHVTPKAQIQWKKQMRMLKTCWGRGWPNKIQNIGRKDVNLGSTTIRQKIRHLTENQFIIGANWSPAIAGSWDNSSNDILSIDQFFHKSEIHNYRFWTGSNKRIQNCVPRSRYIFDLNPEYNEKITMWARQLECNLELDKLLLAYSYCGQCVVLSKSRGFNSHTEIEESR